MRKWLSGRALASQAEGRGFESRLPLHKKYRRRKGLRRFMLPKLRQNRHKAVNAINRRLYFYSEKQAMKMIEQLVILLFQAILLAKT